MRFFTISFIAVTSIVAASCANVVDDPSAVSSRGHANDERALASADVKKYVVEHGRDMSTSEWADIGEGSTPFRGVAWPGGAQGDVAEAGKPLQLNYAPVESTYYVPPAQCQDEFSGTYYPCPDSTGNMVDVQFKNVEMQFRFDDGPIQSMNAVGDEYTMPSMTITIPADGERTMTYWFKRTRSDGSIDWDSQNGANYTVHILAAPSATLSFDSSWKTSESGDVHAGRTFRIAYDMQRMRAEIRKSLGVPDNVGPVDYYIGALVSFDGAQAIEVPIDFDGQVAFQPIVDVPANAKSIAMWFRGWGRFDGTTEVYDSNYGANYHFNVKP